MFSASLGHLSGLNGFHGGPYDLRGGFRHHGGNAQQEAGEPSAGMIPLKMLGGSENRFNHLTASQEPLTGFGLEGLLYDKGDQLGADPFALLCMRQGFQLFFSLREHPLHNP